MAEDISREPWMVAADTLHRRHLAPQETQWLQDPADKVYVSMLGRDLTRLGVAHVVETPVELFHYTKIDNFKSIIQSGTLRASNAEQCNDSKEVVLGRQLIDECLNTQMSRGMPGSVRREFFEFFARDLINRVRPTYYITCFSSRERGRPEWGLYADGGRGVVIVMESAELASSAAIQRSIEIATLRPITYDANDQHKQMEAACDLAYDTIIRRLGRPKSLIKNLPLVASVGAMLSAHLTFQASGFKHEFWADEHEYRLTVSLYGHESDTTAIRNYNGRQYLEISYSDNKLPITRVVVGPLASEDDESFVRQVLRENGYDVSVIRSDIPFRET